MKRLIKLYVIVPVTIVACIVTMTITANADIIRRNGVFIKRQNKTQAMVILNGTVSRCCTDRYNSYVVNGFGYNLKQGQQVEVTFQTKGKQIIDAWISEIK